MRIFNIEINWSPRNYDDDRVWHTSKPNRLGSMRPEELRFELARIHQHLIKDNKEGINTVEGSHRDKFQRIHFRRRRF